jgi:glycine cleavage system aminomethyltransferase T
MVTDDPARLLVGKEALLDGDTPLGYVTSAGYGATVGESILYGYLPVAHTEPGTRLSVWAEGAAHPVTVSTEPLFDPANERMKDVAAPAPA